MNTIILNEQPSTVKAARNYRNRPARLARKEAGQGMTEYILILALIALVAFGLISTFGGTIKNMFQTAVNDANNANQAAINGESQ